MIYVTALTTWDAMEKNFLEVPCLVGGIHWLKDLQPPAMRASLPGKDVSGKQSKNEAPKS